MYVLFIFLLLGKTNSQTKPRSVSSSVILTFSEVIDVILPTLIATSSLLMSLSLGVPFSSPLQRVLLFLMSYLFLVLPSLDFSSPPTDADSTTLGLYSPPSSSYRALADSSSMPPSSPTQVPQSPDDLPITIHKDTCSTCNPHLVYNFLSFHRLSLPYFAFVSTLSSIFTPKSTSEALSHPVRK